LICRVLDGGSGSPERINVIKECASVCLRKLSFTRE